MLEKNAFNIKRRRGFNIIKKGSKKGEKDDLIGKLKAPFHTLKVYDTFIERIVWSFHQDVILWA